MRGSLGREAKAHKTEEELSVEEKALLCDEGDNLFTQTSSQARRAAAHDSKEALKLGKPKPGKASLMEREGSVILDLTRNIQNISAGKKRTMFLLCVPPVRVTMATVFLDVGM
jgi:hypothetical protein